MADPLIVKICGIKTPALLEAAIEAGADMVGFMHVERSPRYVDLEMLQELISTARGRVESCVVLVNPDNSSVMEIAALSPDWIQLHGPETPHRVEAIRDEAGIAIIKALGVGTADGAEVAGDNAPSRHMFLSAGYLPDAARFFKRILPDD